MVLFIFVRFIRSEAGQFKPSSVWIPRRFIRIISHLKHPAAELEIR